jgi:hypothetical protein
MKAKYVCPNCGNKNVRKVSVVYAEGITMGTNPGIAGDYPIRTMTSLAARLAPPTKPSPRFLLIWTLIAVGYAIWWGHNTILNVLFPLLLLGGVAEYFREVSDYNKKQPEWEKQWYCPKCDHEFEPQD